MALKVANGFDALFLLMTRFCLVSVAPAAAVFVLFSSRLEFRHFIGQFEGRPWTANERQGGADVIRGAENHTSPIVTSPILRNTNSTVLNPRGENPISFTPPLPLSLSPAPLPWLVNQTPIKMKLKCQ